MKAENIIGPASIVEKQERPCFGVRFETPFNGMFAVVTKVLKEMRKWANHNGVSEEGPFFLRYHHIDMQGIMDVEVGFMTEADIAEDDRIKRGGLPGGKYATLTYRGNGLRGNQALLNWIRENAIALDHIAGDEASFSSRYEAYLTDYRVEPRKLLWDVELSIKVAG